MILIELFSLFVLMIISKHYSMYLKSLLSIHISHKNRFKSKIHSRKDENTSKDEEKTRRVEIRHKRRRRTSEDEEERFEFFCSSKRTARCFGSNGIRTTTAQTKPVCHFDCRTEYRTVWLIPGTRLADWVSIPKQNSKRSFWMNRITRTVLPRLPAFFVSSCV